jgi:Trypsin
VSTAEVRARSGVAVLPRRRLRGRGVGWVAAAVVAVVALVVGLPLPVSRAQLPHGVPAVDSNAQVRILERGTFRAGGTLVAPNWVLTARHAVPRTGNGDFSVLFGMADPRFDPLDRSNERVIDQVVAAPNGADLVLVHFADPAPRGSWVAGHLATRAPDRYTRASHYGWGPSGHVLGRDVGAIVDLAAAENAARQRASSPFFAALFPVGVTPMVANVVGEAGDSGSGVFTSPGGLTGVISTSATYRPVNASGSFGLPFRMLYEVPVWEYRDWILATIAGPVPAPPPASGDGPPRRQLPDAEPGGGGLMMSIPPPADDCEEEQRSSCSVPEPVWVPGVLLGSGNNRGTVLGVCEQEAGNDCSFDGTHYAAGRTARMALGTSVARSALGTRQVLVWCRSSDAFTAGGPVQPVLRVSFTNADPVESPLGYGWWDVSPDQVGTGAGQTLVDQARLAPC